jgi:hypothetical protein
MTDRRVTRRQYDLRLQLLLAGVVVASACAGHLPQTSSGNTSSAERRGQPLQVVFEDGRAYARQGPNRWLISEVPRDEMLWSPEATRFAYVKAQERRRGGRVVHHLVIRNIRGDSVNEFAVYRPGRPSELQWIGEQHISYLAPPAKGGNVFVVHEVETAEIVRVHRGDRFTWSPDRQHLAYVRGRGRQTIEIDGKRIWPAGCVGVAALSATSCGHPTGAVSASYS